MAAVTNPPKCHCGECRVCKQREKRRKHWRFNWPWQRFAAYKDYRAELSDLDLTYLSEVFPRGRRTERVSEVNPVISGTTPGQLFTGESSITDSRDILFGSRFK